MPTVAPWARFNDSTSPVPLWAPPLRPCTPRMLVNFCATSVNHVHLSLAAWSVQANSADKLEQKQQEPGLRLRWFWFQRRIWMKFTMPQGPMVPGCWISSSFLKTEQGRLDGASRSCRIVVTSQCVEFGVEKLWVESVDHMLLVKTYFAPSTIQCHVEPWPYSSGSGFHHHQWQLALPWLHDCPCWAHVSRPPSPAVAQIEAFSIGSPTILMVIWVFLCLQLEGLV